MKYLRPVLESLRKMPSDELLWTKIHQYLAQRGPLLCWIFFGSESYGPKSWKMSDNLERLPLRFWMEVLIEKTHIRAPYHGKVQKINKLLHIILRNCGLNPPARRFAVLTLYFMHLEIWYASWYRVRHMVNISRFFWIRRCLPDFSLAHEICQKNDG